MGDHNTLLRIIPTKSSHRTFLTVAALRLSLIPAVEHYYRNDRRAELSNIILMDCLITSGLAHVMFM